MAAAALALSAIACGSSSSPSEQVPVFTPEESAGPAVNRIATADRTGADADADQLVLAIEAESIERLFGGSFTLLYDPTLVTVEAVAPGALLSDGYLVSSLDSDRAAPGALMIGFAMSEPAASDPVSGTLATVTIQTLASEPSAIGYQAPSFWLDTRVRALVAADGVGIGGTRWLGGTIDWVEPE